jgi:hypothetical protein
MNYYLFERDLTSNHVSYHYCFLNYDEVKFPENSKIQEHYDYLRKILSTDLSSVKRLSSFHKAITPQNKFIDTPYFHLSVDNISPEEYKTINDRFGINTNYRYNYFTKIISDIEAKEKYFKCGFLSHIFRNIAHDMKSDALEVTRKLFDGNCNVLYAFDFDQSGSIIHDNINIELLPQYSSVNFLKIKNNLKSLFPHLNVELFDIYDKMFLDYSPEKFHFHFKVKLYKNEPPAVKFYRTYNSSNPYLSPINIK